MKQRAFLRWVGAFTIAIASIFAQANEGGESASQPASAPANQPAATIATQPATGPSLDPYAAAPLPAGNPMRWTEPAMPPLLQERITGDAYRQAFTAALARAPWWTAQEARNAPLAGVLVRAVEPGLCADQAGIKPRDVLFKLDDAILTLDSDLFLNRLRKDQTLWVMTPDNHVKSVILHPGPLGMTCGFHWGTFQSYMQAPGHAPQFDDAFQVVGVTYMDDPALAETALWNAWQAGYRGYPLLSAMAYGRFKEHRFDEALAFAMLAMKQATAAERQQLGQLATNAAWMTFNLPLARELRNQYPSANELETASLDAAIEAFSPFADENVPNPIEQLRGMDCQDMTAAIENWLVEQPASDWARHFAQELAAHGKAAFSTGGGSFEMMSIGPCAADVDLRFAIKFHATDQNNPRWRRTFYVAIADAALDGRPVVRLNFFDTGKLEVTRTDGPGSDVWYSPPVTLEEPAHVRITIVGHRMEVVVNGQRLLYGPISNDPGARLMGAVVGESGVTGELTDVSWRHARAKAAWDRVKAEN